MPRDSTGIVVLGGAGGGGIVRSIVDRLAKDGATIEVTGYLNDAEPEGSGRFGAPVLGRFEDWHLIEEANFIAPLHKYDALAERYDRLALLRIPNDRWAPPVVDPLAMVDETAILGAGCYVAAAGTVLQDARIADHVAIRNGACVSHDAEIGNFSFIGSNAVVSGRARLGECVYVGPGAIIGDDVVIGSNAMIGMGTVVSKDVAPGTTVLGRGGRTVRPGT